MKKVIFISCVKRKLSYKAKAKDLYISPWFKKSLEFARSLKPDRIFILSAKYGLVSLEQEIKPYDKTLNTISVDDIKKWAGNVKEQMEGKVDFENDQVIFLAGDKYRKYLVPLFCAKNVHIPLKGLGSFKQLQRLNTLNKKIGHEK